MAGELILYSNPMSRGRIAHWMIEETGAPHRVEYLDYGTTMKDPAYLALNPLGKVPTLQHGDVIVTEGAAICAYLADAFPEADLAPPPGARGPYYRWLFFAAGPLEAAVTNRSLNVDVPDDARGRVGYGDLPVMLDALEAALDPGPFIAGDRFSAADVFVGSHIGWGMQFGTIEARPAFRDYWARISDRPARARADEACAAHMPETGAA